LSPFLLSAGLGLAAATVCLVALILIHHAAGFTRANAPLFAAFAGGLVITLALVHLIPKAFLLHPWAPWLVLAGFASGFLLQALVNAAPGSKPKANRLSALTPVVAIAIHSALDGAVYAVTSVMDVFTALSTAPGLILHELPETLICFILLQRAGFPDRTATVLAFMAAGATTLGAALIGAPFAQMLNLETLGALFAVVAGLLLHVGAAHLLNEAGETGLLRGSGAVFAGAGIAAVMTLSHAATHNHAHAGDRHETGHDHDHNFHPASDNGVP